jgi:uncharacterized membrane protein YdcZ (DUF606 family)
MLWAVCGSLFLVGIVLFHFSIALTYTIFGEVNSRLPEERRISPIFGTSKVLPVIRMHREMFPSSRKPQRLWLFWIGGVLGVLASFGVLIAINIIGLA